MKIIKNLYVIIILSLINNCQIINAQSNCVKPTILNNNYNFNILKYWGYTFGNSSCKYYEEIGKVFITNLDTNKYKHQSIGYIYNDFKNQYELINVNVSNSGEKIRPDSWYYRNTIEMNFKLNDSTILRINAATTPEEIYEKNDSIALNKILDVINFQMFAYSENVRKRYYFEITNFYRGYDFKNHEFINSFKKYFPDIFNEVEKKYINEYGRSFINYSGSNKLKIKNVGGLINDISRQYKLLKTTMVNDSSFFESFIWLNKYNIIYTFLKDDSTLLEVGIRFKDTIHKKSLSKNKIESIKNYESDFILIDIDKYCKQTIDEEKNNINKNELSYSDLKDSFRIFEHDRLIPLILKYYPNIAVKNNLIQK